MLWFVGIQRMNELVIHQNKSIHLFWGISHFLSVPQKKSKETNLKIQTYEKNWNIEILDY